MKLFNCDKYILKIEKYIPERLKGKNKIYEKYLYKIYGSIDNKEAIKNFQIKNIKKYMFLLFVILIILIFNIYENINSNEKIFYDKEKKQQYITKEKNKSKIINMEVKAKINNKIKSKKISVKVESQKKIKKKSNKVKKNDFDTEIRYMKLNIDKNTNDTKIYLPTNSGKLNNIKWKIAKENDFIFIIIVAFSCFLFIYFSKYDLLKKYEKSKMNDIEHELPEFINKIILFMNAGMVLSTSLKKIIEDNKESNSYFYTQLNDIYIKSVSVNKPIITELRKFALRSENKEFLRIIGVIEDNVNKGTELINILTNESKLIWFLRKKNFEERGKIIETKLNMPIAMQLVALIIITIAPALLQV